MTDRSTTRIGIFSLICLCVGTLAPMAHAEADAQREYYLEALRIADQHVRSEKARKSRLSATLGTSIVSSVFGREYVVGDRWEVAAIQMVPTAMRRVSDPEGHPKQEGKVGIFRYEVTDVKSGPNARVTLRVTQLERPEIPVVDPAIRELTLRVDSRFRQVEKNYLKRGFSNVLRVVPEIRSRITELELFPLDAPMDLDPGEASQAKSIPELPKKLQKLAREAGWKPDLSRTQAFDRSDFFGRPVEYLWEQGSPWPAYLKTPHGVAILISREEAR